MWRGGASTTRFSCASLVYRHQPNLGAQKGSCKIRKHIGGKRPRRTIFTQKTIINQSKCKIQSKIAAKGRSIDSKSIKNRRRGSRLKRAGSGLNGRSKNDPKSHRKSIQNRSQERSENWVSEGGAARHNLGQMMNDE